MKVIKLKKLPSFDYTSPMAILSETQAIVWAAGRGVKTLYYCEKMEQWIIRMDDEDG